jgi:hypothetical protein
LSKDIITLVDQVCEHFIKHPDDELDAGDIASQFKVPITRVDAYLNSGVASGRLNRIGKVGTLPTFCAGPLLAKPPAPAVNGKASSAPLPPTAAAKKPRTILPPIDAAALAVDASEPIPTKRLIPPRAPTWPPLLERLVKVGQHSSIIPKAYKAGLKAASAKWAKEHGGKFAVFEVSDTHVRIWRTE